MVNKSLDSQAEELQAQREKFKVPHKETCIEMKLR